MAIEYIVVIILTLSAFVCIAFVCMFIALMIISISIDVESNVKKENDGEKE